MPKTSLCPRGRKLRGFSYRPLYHFGHMLSRQRCWRQTRLWAGQYGGKSPLDTGSFQNCLFWMIKILFHTEHGPQTAQNALDPVDIHTHPAGNSTNPHHGQIIHCAQLMLNGTGKAVPLQPLKAVIGTVPPLYSPLLFSVSAIARSFLDTLHTTCRDDRSTHRCSW